MPRQDVQVQHLLSCGAFREVYAGLYNGKRVDVKMLSSETRRVVSYVNNYIAEAKMTANINHPRIVRFIVVGWDSLTLIENNNGDYKKWVCSAKGYKWLVAISRRRVKEKTKSKRKRPASMLSHHPPNSWYISNSNLQHAQCCISTANPTGAQIAKLPGFQASILEGHNTSKSRVVNNLKAIENINVSGKRAVLYRIIKAAITGMARDGAEGFKTLPACMELFAQQNPGSRVCCQLDTSGRLFRSFLSIGATVSMQYSLLPVWESDSTYMKDADYNGVCVTLLGEDVDKRIVPVAVAYVHKETTDDFV
ncbi:hypothetical protein ON010_g17355 [Phytophthora cinnamomi]|nr:hypothetical protein ON010_g17355 [Phytophthora cinnamomi]